MSIKHAFTSPITDAGDPNLVGPDEWNDDHIYDFSPTLDEDSTDETGITSTSPTADGLVGFTFVAPVSGKIYITVSAYAAMSNNTRQTYVGFEVREGSTIGSGTVVTAADTDHAIATSRAVTSGGPSEIQASRRHLVTGLTAGDTYNARTMRWVNTTGGGSVYYRSLLVEPVGPI